MNRAAGGEGLAIERLGLIQGIAVTQERCQIANGAGHRQVPIAEMPPLRRQRLSQERFGLGQPALPAQQAGQVGGRLGHFGAVGREQCAHHVESAARRDFRPGHVAARLEQEREVAQALAHLLMRLAVRRSRTASACRNSGSAAFTSPMSCSVAARADRVSATSSCTSP